MNNNVKGFSKLSKEEKINWITNTYFSNPVEAKESLLKYWNSDENLQKLHDEFIENTLTNFICLMVWRQISLSTEKAIPFPWL